MIADLVLAILHHVLAFSLLGLLAAEAALLRPGLSGAWLTLLGRLDGLYGGAAMALVVVGIGRLIWGLKGWEFYVASWSFWAKMAAFAAVGIASILPTLRILAWRRAARLEPSHVVPDAEIAGARRLVLAELALFALIPVFAAMMARGIGS
ncbi:MAG: DUF2214 family protein [Rhizobiaceae bacterium]|nr:MAG: DUF2214 family protein [Rhizobiaceae bacterium]CAG1014820.1 hypothetical protein RHIZO_04889 [Rhizobiaceae bacterium]